MFATTTRSADPRPAIWAALILAAVVAAGAVIAAPRTQAGVSAPAAAAVGELDASGLRRAPVAVTNDDHGLDASGLRRAPVAVTNDDHGLDASGLRRAPVAVTNDDHGLDGAGFRRGPTPNGTGSGSSGPRVGPR